MLELKNSFSSPAGIRKCWKSISITSRNLWRRWRRAAKRSCWKKCCPAAMPEGKLFLTRQQKALGLGHAVWCARQFVGDEPFAVFLVDDVILNDDKGCMQQMIDAYDEVGGNLVAVMDVPRADTAKYGVIDIEKEDGRLVGIKGMVEKPKPEDAPSTLSVVSRYILQPEIFAHLGKFETGAGGEIQLTDAIARLIGVQPLHGLRFEGTRYDCGHRLGLLEANIAYNLRDPEIGADVRQILAKFR